MFSLVFSAIRRIRSTKQYAMSGTAWSLSYNSQAESRARIHIASVSGARFVGRKKCCDVIILCHTTSDCSRHDVIRGRLKCNSSHPWDCANCEKWSPAKVSKDPPGLEKLKWSQNEGVYWGSALALTSGGASCGHFATDFFCFPWKLPEIRWF